MRVQAFKRICKDPRLEQFLVHKHKVKSRHFAGRLIEANQEDLYRLFLASVYEKRTSHDAKRLFKEFIKLFNKLPEEKQRSLSDPFHKELEKVKSVFSKHLRGYDENFTESDFLIKDLPVIVEELQATKYKRARKEEEEVNKVSLQNKEILRGLAHFQSANDKAYPHSIVQLNESPKMIIIGTPRHDRQDTLEHFFSVMIKEDVDVIIALNTPSDWEEAIPYYEHEHIGSIKIDGYTLERERYDKVLYEGEIEANMPLSIKKSLDKMTESERMLVLKRYLPRIIERIFWVRDDALGSWRKITQLHYENWPDRAEAPDLEGWWVLLKRQLELQKGAICIHCQGGIGRTNAHAILTCLISQFNAKKDEVFNVARTMYQLKEQAPRLGGVICAKRFGQIYEMLLRYSQTAA